jgi:hypothetical protein
MANPLRGEVDLQVGEKTYTLRLSINAIAEVETLLDKGINEILSTLDPQNARIGTLRAILWASLQEHHPEITLLDAGDLIGDVGAENAGPIIGDAIKAAFPAPDGKPRPPKAAKVGTGKAS